MGGRTEDIYTYEAPWTIYAMNWSVRPDKKFRLAIGSFLEECDNKVQIVQLNEETSKIESQAQFENPYPATKVMWIPDKTGQRADLLATSADYLRLWKVGDDNKVTMASLLNNNKSYEFCSPLTSFDWNEIDPCIVATSSIDTTCTIWDVETCQAKTQLIAHDKEVYDVAFAPSTDQVFASTGADGSVRMFDLRSLKHSTIIYESPEFAPLLRLSWNKQDSHYLATFAMDQRQISILDIRVPAVPVAEVRGHHENVNSVAWSPHGSRDICTGGDDHQVCIWDLNEMRGTISDPTKSYNAEAPINTVQWSPIRRSWVAITFHTSLQILRV